MTFTIRTITTTSEMRSEEKPEVRHLTVSAGESLPATSTSSTTTTVQSTTVVRRTMLAKTNYEDRMRLLNKRLRGSVEAPDVSSSETILEST